MIVLFGCLLYGRTLSFPFVWDGLGYVLGNPLIKGFGYYDDIFHFHELGQLDEKLGIPSDYVTNFTLRPITYLTFTINYVLGGNNPVGYRAGNVAIHIANAVLIFLLLETILKKEATSGRIDSFSLRFISTSTAMLFLFHPLQTESVIYIAQRFTSLAATFYLLTMFLFIRSLTTDAARLRRLLYWLSVATLVMGMLTKEEVFTAPIILLLMTVIVLRKPLSVSLKTTVPHLLCLPLIPALVAVTSAVQNTAGLSLKGSVNVVNFYNYSVLHYAITQLSVIATYLRLLLLPYGQNVDYDYPLYTSLLQGRVILALILVAIIVLSAVQFYRRSPQQIHRRLVLFGVVFFFVAISITSSIIPLAELIAERRTYIPSFGAFLVLICAMDLMRLKWPRLLRNSVLVAGVGIWLVILGGVTYARSEVWRSKISFWQDASTKSPDKVRPMLALVAAYWERKQYEQASIWLKKIVSLRPNEQSYYVLLEELQYLRGLYADSIETGVQALHIGEGTPKIYYLLGLAYGKIGMNADSERALDYALFLQPNFLDAHRALAEYYFSAKRYPDALHHYREASVLDKGNKRLMQIVQDLERKTGYKKPM